MTKLAAIKKYLESKGVRLHELIQDKDGDIHLMVSHDVPYELRNVVWKYFNTENNIFFWTRDEWERFVHEYMKIGFINPKKHHVYKA
jgi:hypothetical protein